MVSGNIKKFELKLGRTGLIIVIAGMTVLLCLSFILGVGVGKNINTYPEKISSVPQQILALFWRPAKVAGEQKKMASMESPPDSGNMDLTFHDTLTGQKTLSIQQPPVAEKKPDNAMVKDQKAKPQNPPAVLSPQEEAVSSKAEASELKVTVSEKSPVEKKSKIKEVPTAVQPAGSSFLVYVASLKDKAKANQINKTVATLGYSAKVVKVDIKGKGTWHRVIVTGFETKAQAQAAADRISKKVKTNCIIRAAVPDAIKTQ
ncbi:MAG: sporulation domain-containing protein [Syntrophaceae bacterium]|nr:MAG: sporulation domain-containing protein [Syntrophaceae bacterium]